MPVAATAYLVVRQQDGFGDVFPLTVGQRYTLGRAATNRIVLKDDLCSREHCEVFFADSHWRLRDLNSLNGTYINGERLDSDWELSPSDDVHLGRTHLLFVEDMAQLPDLPEAQPHLPPVAIKKRLGHTRFLTPLPPDGNGSDPGRPARHRLSSDLAHLYRLALDMGSAATYQDLVTIVLDGLLGVIPADVGAILSVKEGHELEVMAHRHRTASNKPYVKVSQFVSSEVLASRESILAEDIAVDQHLSQRESISELGATSLICAPVTFGDTVLALVHLYCTEPDKSLDAEDLEFALAVAKQLGVAHHHMERQASLTLENQSLRDQLKLQSELVGSSPPLKAIETQISRVAGTNATVLVRGESGSGKELVARAIHFSSLRKDGPFICLNCAALPETLLESELFGHEKGAFTGATEKKIGKFEAAGHGTIFLDEIGEMAPGTQAKLLRVLEGHPFERVGGNSQIRVDVRVVAATNQPLEQNLQAGTFRRDLFFRLQVVEIRVPPLRERKADIRPLAELFLRRFVQETGRKLSGFTPAAMKKMEEYHWPGNVRELRNVVERAVALGSGPAIDAPDVWLSSLETGGPVPLLHQPPPYQPLSLEDVEKKHIAETLQHTDWNKSQAAAILAIERSTLDRKIKLFDLKR